MTYLQRKKELYDKLTPAEKYLIPWKDFKPISLKKKYTDDDEITKLLDLYAPEKEQIDVLSKSKWHTMPLICLKKLTKNSYKAYDLKLAVSKMTREQLINALGQLLYLVDKKEYYS
jgi:hypothetical protein